MVSVVPDTRVQPSPGDTRLSGAEREADVRRPLEQALSARPAGVRATTELRPGPVVDALPELRPEDCDVLVRGSRGYGPVRSVLLGGVSSRVVRHSRVPVVVVPRGG